LGDLTSKQGEQKELTVFHPISISSLYCQKTQTKLWGIRINYNYSSEKIQSVLLALAYSKGSKRKVKLSVDFRCGGNRLSLSLLRFVGTIPLPAITKGTGVRTFERNCKLFRSSSFSFIQLFDKIDFNWTFFVWFYPLLLEGKQCSSFPFPTSFMDSFSSLSFQKSYVS